MRLLLASAIVNALYIVIHSSLIVDRCIAKWMPPVPQPRQARQETQKTQRGPIDALEKIGNQQDNEEGEGEAVKTLQELLTTVNTKYE